MKIKTWRDPYDTGVSLTNPSEVEFHPGITVLVGCNGAGKTTLLRNIEDHCKGAIPCHKYDNIRDGGSSTVLDGMFADVPSGFDVDSIGLGAAMLFASEGEAIKMHVARQYSLYDTFFKEGNYTDLKYRMTKLFNKEDTEYTTKDRVLLFDATDSGLSIDSVCELKLVFNNAMARANELGVDLYIIIAANEYELCRESDCFDVTSGKYLTFSDYEDYRKFILQSRKHKDARIEKESSLYEQRSGEELAQFYILIKQAEPKVKRVYAKKQSGARLDSEERETLSGRHIRHFVSQSRYLDLDLFNEAWEELMTKINEE